MNKKIEYVKKHLLNELKIYGAIHWHTSVNDSVYIVFKDRRLGSIRIADHKSRKQYHYTYDINVNRDNLKQIIFKTVNKIIEKISSIKDFCPETFVVWYDMNWYELKDFEEYKYYVLKKKLKSPKRLKTTFIN